MNSSMLADYTTYPLLSLITAFIGSQIQMSELSLLTRHYNYKIQLPQCMTYASIILSVAVILCEVCICGFHALILVEIVACILLWLIAEYILSKLSPHRLAVSIMWRISLIIVMACTLLTWSFPSLVPFVAIGICFRNSPLGCVHGKPFFLAYRLRRHPQPSPHSKHSLSIPQADYVSSKKHIDVSTHGILPGTGKDVLPMVQALIDDIGQNGGGTLFFPKGRYMFNMSGDKSFLQINHSHISIEGECDRAGHILTTFVNCGTTVQGHRNPWLSPFFITTGEAIQPSNIFWGLDFRRPKHIHMESSSLSDPGSDGHILTPPFATIVTTDSMAGETILHVEDSSAIGQYIMLGMYNTTPDGNLIKELLGVVTLRPEWLTAHRAGQEGAPSFQWLTEVRRVIDSHTIELCQPLLRDCLMKYKPAIFNVEMLEDIHIRNVSISSRWNGLFHHHGIPLYYSVAQAQEMDYGWNGINMKRAAHSSIYNVEIRNFTNPLYIQDSYDTNISHAIIDGYDGHQGLKAYCHTSNCIFSNITFRCHFADMMGGEGNAYANTFRQIHYVNPTFNPVDYDFHGFGEGPMSPPAYNLFDHDSGFRYIKGAGAVFMQPATGIGNTWRDCTWEGNRIDTIVFYAMSYRVRSKFTKLITALGYTIVIMMKNRRWKMVFAKDTFVEKLKDLDYMSIPRMQHYRFFPKSRL